MLNRDELSNKILLHVTLIVLLGLLAYSNTINVPFVFDDEPNILQNPRIKDISNIPSMFIRMEGVWASRPLMHATNALNYYFGGFDSRGYHAINLVVHLLNGILLYFLVICTGKIMDYEKRGTHLAAFASSLIFVLHPLQTEGVTYIVSRSMLFSTCFFISGILLFVRAVTSVKRNGIYTLALLAVSLLGMASRENFATFPVVLFLYDLFFVSKFRLREAVGHYRLYLPVVLSLAYMTYMGLNNTYAVRMDYPAEEGILPVGYALTQFNVHWTYIRMLVLPVNQSIDHHYPISQTLFELPVLLSLLGYVGLWALSILIAKKQPVAAFGILWFLIILTPISFLVTLLGLRLEDILLEHRTYLPNAGMICAAVMAVAMLIKRISSKKVMTATIMCGMILVVLFVPATYARNSVWGSNISIWEDVVRKAPDKWRGHNNLGNHYQEAELFEKAIGQFKEAIRIEPDKADSYYNLGNSYKQLGLYDMALEQYQISLKKDPGQAKAYNNIGNIYLARELYDKALEQYRQAIALKPNYVDVHYNMGIAYYYRGTLDKAAEHYIAALAISPNDPEVYYNLGVAYMDMRETDKAREAFKEALRINPNLLEARQALLNLAASESGQER